MLRSTHIKTQMDGPKQLFVPYVDDYAYVVAVLLLAFCICQGSPREPADILSDYDSHSGYSVGFIHSRNPAFCRSMSARDYATREDCESHYPQHKLWRHKTL